MECDCWASSWHCNIQCRNTDNPRWHWALCRLQQGSLTSRGLNANGGQWCTLFSQITRYMYVFCSTYAGISLLPRRKSTAGMGRGCLRWLGLALGRDVSLHRYSLKFAIGLNSGLIFTDLFAVAPFSPRPKLSQILDFSILSHNGTYWWSVRWKCREGSG